MRQAVFRHARGNPRPFLKWAGGKRRLLNVLDAHVPQRIDAYFEPFVGGGALFWHLYRMRPAIPYVHLSDSNERLVRAYYAIKHEPERVVARLREYEEAHAREGKSLFLRSRKIDDASASDSEVAAWLIYVNKVGFNGLYRVNSEDEFNVSYGDYEDPTVLDEANLRSCSVALQNASILCADACERLSRLRVVTPSTVVYLDPVYAPASETASFDAYTAERFGEDAQRRLAKEALRLKEAGARVIVTNSDAPLVREIYPEAKWRVERVEVRGNALNRDGSKRGRVAELVIT